MNDVVVVEVGPRDGLQNEPTLVSTADKIELVDQLGAAGLRKIEVTSFVSPKWVPQMADAADVMAGIARKTDVTYAALTPNLRGLLAAQNSAVDEVAVFASASEGFSQANINCSVAQSLERFQPVLDSATVPVRGYISCIVECPYDGLVDPVQVVDLALRMLEMGCFEISLGDTIGRAKPAQIERLLSKILDAIPAGKLAGHFHDTNAQAIEHIDVSLDAGVRVFDAAIGGLGGCPYAPGAAGNVATEGVVAHLHARGFSTGVDETKLAKVAGFAKTLRGLS
jgi:hydroxymethylglutaryl-CoA lyase